MEENEKAVQPTGKKGLSPKGKIAVTCGAAAVGLLLAGYLGVCALAGGDRALPGTYMGGVDLSGMTVEQAQAALEQVSTDRYEGLEIPIQVGDKTVPFSARQAQVRVTGGAEDAVQAGKGSFFARGWNYLAGLLGRKTEVGFDISVDNADYVNDVFDRVTQAVDQPIEQPHWELEEDESAARLILYKGKTGQSVDQEALRQALMDALGQGEAEPIRVEVSTQAPDEFDFDAMVLDVDREGVNATLDLETDEVVPHKLGLKVDVDQAKKLVAGLAEGESCPLELEVQEPEVTTLKLRSTLFRDILGEASSPVHGTANRVNNVKLASAACNGVILLPGEKFSYNQTTGQRTYAKGYREASGYSSKGVVDMVGGGVCQPSSTLYLASLRANMEIVTRYNHMYTVSYMPEGMDATVSWPNVDYVFANNTPYPVKVEMKVENGNCIARIYGTKTDNTRVEMESVRLSTTPFNTIYRADESVPQGTTQVLVTPFTGKSVEVYKKTYAADGSLISRVLISKDRYLKCDRVIGYNPADGAPDGSVAPVDPDAPILDPETGVPLDPETGLPIDPVGSGEVSSGQESQAPATGGETTVEPSQEPSAEPAPAETAPAEPAPVEPVPELPPVPEGIVVE